MSALTKPIAKRIQKVPKVPKNPASGAKTSKSAGSSAAGTNLNPVLGAIVGTPPAGASASPGPTTNSGTPGRTADASELHQKVGCAQSHLGYITAAVHAGPKQLEPHHANDIRLWSRHPGQHLFVQRKSHPKNRTRIRERQQSIISGSGQESWLICTAGTTSGGAGDVAQSHRGAWLTQNRLTSMARRYTAFRFLARSRET